MKSKYLAMLAGGLVATLAPAAMSACVYTITTDAPSYDASSGTATVKIYLNETLTNGSTSFADSTTQKGVLGAHIVVTRESGDSAKLGDITPSAPFGDTALLTTALDYENPWTSDASPTWVYIQATRGITQPSGARFNGASLLIATLTMVPDTGTIPSVYSINLRGDTGGWVATTEGYYLDADPVSQGLAADAFVPVAPTGLAFQVAVPEPASLALIAVTGMMLLRRRV